MPTTYKVQNGDTYSTISKKVYGSEEYASLIKSANPGESDTPQTGSTIAVPDNVDYAQPKINNVQKQSDNPSITIEGKEFKYWESMRITYAMDTISTVEFSAPFEANDPTFRATFKPFSFKDVVLKIGDETIFTGTMVDPIPNLTENKKMINVSCYAKCGVLNDCTPPASAYPIEANGQNLEQIANTLLKPFGLKAIFKDSAGAVFERVECGAEEKIYPFLAKLAKERNIVISSDINGNLLFQKPIDTGLSKAVFRQGEAPLLSVTPSFNPQDYFSTITGVDSVIIGEAGTQFTMKNSKLGGVIRPYTFQVKDTLDSDIKTTVESKVGRMLGNMVAYSIQVSTWRDDQGKLFEPNTIVTLLAPDAMVYKEYKMTIRSVELNRDEEKMTATLNLIIGGAFSGKLPEVLPWED